MLSCPSFLSNSRGGPTYQAPHSPVNSATCCSVVWESWRNSSWRKSATWRRRRACCQMPQLPTGWRQRARWTPSWRGSASWRKVWLLSSHQHQDEAWGDWLIYDKLEQCMTLSDSQHMQHISGQEKVLHRGKTQIWIHKAWNSLCICCTNGEEADNGTREWKSWEGLMTHRWWKKRGHTCF